MKLKEDYVKHDFKDFSVLIPINDERQEIIRINDTTSFIIDCLKEETDVDTIVKKMSAEYEADEDILRADVLKVIASLEEIEAI